mmetsp:Transcript_39253/g.94474  ORF Transcript_39253/g.94474 Transcript_39253/m.94474 type:complete len:201 (-) Transcript_39253:2125-2727(-)
MRVHEGPALHLFLLLRHSARKPSAVARPLSHPDRSRHVRRPRRGRRRSLFLRDERSRMVRLLREGVEGPFSVEQKPRRRAFLPAIVSYSPGSRSRDGRSRGEERAIGEGEGGPRGKGEETIGRVAWRGRRGGLLRRAAEHRLFGDRLCLIILFGAALPQNMGVVKKTPDRDVTRRRPPLSIRLVRGRLQSNFCGWAELHR